MVKDFLGQEIKPGCVVVYPVRSGARMWLEKIHVQQVGEGGVSGYKADGRRAKITVIDRCVVAPAGAA